MTGEQLLAFEHSLGKGNKLTSQQANDIAGLSLVVTQHASSGTLKSAQGKSGVVATDFTAADNGTALVDIRQVSGTVYLQADVEKILQLANQPADVFKNLQAETSQMPSFVGALLNGKWVSLKDSDVKALEQEAQGLTGGAQASSSPSASQKKQILSDLTTIFSRDVTVTENQSTSNGGTYTLTAHTRALVTDFLSDISSIEPALQSKLGQFKPSMVPSKKLSFDVTVTGGKVSQLSFDVVQLAPPHANVPAGSHFPILADFDTATRVVKAPSGATPVSLSQLTGLLSAVGGGV